MAFEGFTLGTIIVLAIFISVPLVFFTWLSRRLCCDKQLKHIFQQSKDELAGRSTSSARPKIAAPPKVLMTFRSVRYAVPLPDGTEKQILKGVSAYFKPGTLTAVMGPSGCGKSTLLDVLADQKEFGTIAGEIRINGKFRSALFRRASAYVLQFDVLYPQLTPRETLFFVTELRLGETVSTEEKYQRVLDVLEDLDLMHVADTRIGAGESGGGLSGGQKRRVTVAIELVTGPGLILLDEPTSGLDSFGSLKLVSVLRKLGDAGRTIACTIHQPRADIFKMFDNLLLLKLGVTMYFGPVSQIFPYFEGLGIKVDYNVNPADFIVDLTQDKSEEEKEEERRVLERLRLAAAEGVADEAGANETSKGVEDKVAQDGSGAPSTAPGAQTGATVGGKSEDAAASDTSAAVPASSDGGATSDASEDKLAAEAALAGPAASLGKQASGRLGQDGDEGGADAVPATALKDPIDLDLDALVEEYGRSAIRKESHRYLFQVSRGVADDVPPPLEELFADSKDAAAKYPTPFLKQTFTLARRSIVNDMRNGAYVTGNWIVGPIMMLFYGALYSNVPSPQRLGTATINNVLLNQEACNLNDTNLALYDPAQSVQTLTECGSALNQDETLSFVRASLIYQFMAAAYFSEGPFVAQVYLDKRIFFREHSARSYSSGAYHFAYMVRMFFSAFVKGLIFPVFGYFAAQLTLSAEAYFLFCIFFGAMSACGASMALLCSSAFPGLEIAQSVFVLINIIAQNLSGYWIVQSYIGWWFRWMYYINLFRYGFEGAILAQALPGSADVVMAGSKLTVRQEAWLFALIVIIFAVCLQLFAFLATFMTHRTSITDNEQLVMEEDAALAETEFSSSREEYDRMRESSGFGVCDEQGKMRGYRRGGLVDRYRDAQMYSTRTVGGRSPAALNTTLAQNGGVVYTQ